METLPNFSIANEIRRVSNLSTMNVEMTEMVDEFIPSDGEEE